MVYSPVEVHPDDVVEPVQHKPDEAFAIAQDLKVEGEIEVCGIAYAHGCRFPRKGNTQIQTDDLVRLIAGYKQVPGAVVADHLHALHMSGDRPAELLIQKDYATLFLPMTQGYEGYFGNPYSNDMDHVVARDVNLGHWYAP